MPKYRNDCVHGMIAVPDHVGAVIATPVFQRLGRIRQTSSLDKAWSSAVHTRREHSEGTMHLASVYARLLGLSAYETKIFELASLLHDIGHGPFSHAFERITKGTPSGDFFGDHDQFRVYLLMTDPGLLRTMSLHVRDDIACVWSGRPSGTGRLPACRVRALHTLLAGVGGVDRMDYILRDSYHVTPQRRLDVTCIQSIMHHTSISQTTGRVLYDRKGVRFLAHFLKERSYLYNEVYSHARSMAGDLLLVKAFTAGLEPIVRPLITDNFERLDDAFILQCAWDPAVPDMARALLLRYIRSDLPKVVDGPTEHSSTATLDKAGLSPEECPDDLVAAIEGDGVTETSLYDALSAIGIPSVHVSRHYQL